MTPLLKIAAAAAALLAPLVAHATVAIPVPEPDSWALVAIGLVAAVVVMVRNRRK